MSECDECGGEVEHPLEHCCQECGSHIAGAPEYLSDEDQILAVVAQHADGCSCAEALFRTLPCEPNRSR